jgi:hypothetical protein
MKDITLHWSGPFESPNDLPDLPGVYAVTGHIYGSSHTHLLYVGLANQSICDRWTCGAHRDWLRRTQTVLDGRLYACPVEERELINDIETILIFVHQPNENSSKLNKDEIKQHMLIRSVGSVPTGVLPLIDTTESWFGLTPAFQTTAK